MEAETQLGPADFLRVVRRNRSLALAVFLAVFSVAAAFALALPDVYRSQAIFNLVDDSVPGVGGDRQTSADQYVFGLSDRVMRSSQLRRLVTDMNPYPALSDTPDAAFAELRSDIDVAMISESILGGGGREQEVRKGFAVGYENRSPEVAYAVATRLVELFFEISRGGELERVNHDIRFLTSEVDRSRAVIAEQEKRLAQFKERNFNALPEVALANMNQRSQAERELEGVLNEIRSLQQNRVFLAQQLQQAQSGPVLSNLQQLEEEYARKSALYSPGHPDLIALRRQIDSIRAAGPTQAGNSLEAQLAAEKASLAEARQRYSAEHPDIRRIQRNIDLLETQIAAGQPGPETRGGQTLVAIQLTTQLNSVDTQIRGLQERAARLGGNMAQLETRLGATPEVEREYQALTRDLGAARQQYEQMTDRRMNAELTASAITTGAADKFVLLDKPLQSLKPDKPARAKLLIVGLIFAMIAAAGATLAAELLSSAVRGARDIRGTLGVSPLAVVPLIRNSVFRRRRWRRIAAFAGSLAVGFPALCAVIYLASR